MPLYDKPSVTFRLNYLEILTGKTLAEDIREKLHQLTGGHGKLMRMTSEAYLSAEKKPQELTEFFLTQNIVTAALSEIWLSFSPLEQRYLLDLENPEHKDTEYAHYFQSVGLVEKDVITIPLLSSYINQANIRGDVTKATLTYDEKTNRIFKGNIVLSDDLTSSEFLLLRMFVTNPEKILSRDELIDVVWGENKSTSGVTDQALDQLVFRIRQKVEEDPKNPEHIVTLKGRGFKFSP